MRCPPVHVNELPHDNLRGGIDKKYKVYSADSYFWTHDYLQKKVGVKFIMTFVFENGKIKPVSGKDYCQKRAKEVFHKLGAELK